MRHPNPPNDHWCDPYWQGLPTPTRFVPPVPAEPPAVIFCHPRWGEIRQGDCIEPVDEDD